MTEQKLEVIHETDPESKKRLDKLRAVGKLVTDQDYPKGSKGEDPRVKQEEDDQSDE